MSAASVDVVIVNFNARAHLAACLASLAPEAVGEVVVVDSSSTDGSAELVAAKHAGVRLLTVPNRGYGAAANRGVSETTGEHVLLLNSDTVLHAGAAHALAAYLGEVPRAGLVGPRLIDPDGALQPSCFPFLTPVRVLLAMTPLNELIGAAPGLRDRHLPTSAHDRPRPVPWVKGAALAIRRRAFDDVGGFDESFFMYYEELDLSYRLHAAGWEVHFTPQATVIHDGGASTSQRREQMTAELYASLLRVSARHLSRRQLVGLRVALGAVLAAKLADARLRLLRTSDGMRRAELEADVRALRRALAVDLRGSAPSARR